MDKDSMVGRLYCAWLEHRHEEYCRPVQNVIGGEFNRVADSDETILDPQTYNGIWGGIPFIYFTSESQKYHTIFSYIVF
jgi:hypothetical protein